MARLRRVVRRRYPMRRRFYRRRLLRSRFLRRRKLRSGCMRVKLTRITTYELDVAKPVLWAANIQGSDFREFENVATGYESYRFSKMRVTVLPLPNISLNTQPGSTNQTLIPCYAMFPWHKSVPTGDNILFSDSLSIDRHKLYRGTQVGRQTYNLNTISTAKDDNGNKAVAINWAPKIAIQGDYNFIRHYGGMIAFQGLDGAPEGTKVKFNIKQDVYCTFYNQSILPVPKT